MDTEIYRKFDKFCLLLQSYLCIAAILLLTFGIDAILFSSSALAEPPVYYLNSDQLNDHSLNWSTPNYWSNADGSSPSNIPDNVNGCIFAVGDDYMLRTPEVDDPQTFPYNESGEYNKLYLGYNHNASAFDTGYLNLKCKSVRIDNLIFGNGVIDQGLFNSHVTLQGAITVNGNATVMINDESSHEDRLLTIESSIAGSGTLNFTTAYRESRIGFHLASASNSFNGSIVVDDKSSISFEAEDVFVNASSITSAGDLTISANQTFNNLSGSGGSISIGSNKVLTLNHASNATYGGSISGTGSLVKTGSGELTIPGTLNYTGDTTISNGTLNLSGSVHLYNLTGAGNLVYNSPGDILKLEYTSNKTFVGVISGTSPMEKKGSGSLTLTQTPDIGPTKLSEGNLILEAGGTLCNLSGSGNLINDIDSQPLTINYYSDKFWSNETYSGNITNSSDSEALTINYYTDRTNSGNIVSSQGLNIYVDSDITATHSKTISSTNGALVKTGNGTLKLTSSENPSINCDVVINGGTILLDNKVSDKNRFGEGRTVTINAGGTLACNAQDSFGNGGANVTLNINGGTLQLNSEKNQTFMNKTVEMTGGKIKSLVTNCTGIEMKTGSSITAHASPVTSTISVPIKVRSGLLLNITVDANARLEFTSAIYKQDKNTKGIEKEGPGVLVFAGTFYDSTTPANVYNSKITVSNGVLQLRDEAIQTYGPIEVKNGANLEFYVGSGETKNLEINTRTIYDATVINSILSTGVVKKTGDGTLKIVSETQGMISAESMFVSSGRLDMQGYFKGLLSVDNGGIFSPGNSPGILTIGDQTYGGGFILNEAGAELLMEIRGTDASQNDALIVDYGNLELHDGSIVYLAATDDCTLQDGQEFTAVLHGANSSTIKNDFISKYVRSSDFNNLEYVKLTSGAYSGKYAITGRRYIDPNAVPEPSTWALLILGVAGLFCLKKLRKN